MPDKSDPQGVGMLSLKPPSCSVISCRLTQEGCNFRWRGSLLLTTPQLDKGYLLISFLTAVQWVLSSKIISGPCLCVLWGRVGSTYRSSGSRLWPIWVWFGNLQRKLWNCFYLPQETISNLESISPVSPCGAACFPFTTIEWLHYRDLDLQLWWLHCSGLGFCLLQKFLWFFTISIIHTKAGFTDSTCISQLHTASSSNIILLNLWGIQQKNLKYLYATTKTMVTQNIGSWIDMPICLLCHNLCPRGQNYGKN